MNELYIKTRSEWRKWLSRHHKKSEGVRLIFYKKETGKPSLDYEATVEEALCFGWIDSLIRKIDDEKYTRKFTPRNKNSVWSDLNKKRVSKLIKKGRMSRSGLEVVNSAKKSGIWNKEFKIPATNEDIPREFTRLFAKNEKAKHSFEKLPPSQRKRYCLWINQARKKETREKRINEAVKLLNNSLELGLK